MQAVVWIVVFAAVAGVSGISRAEFPAYPKVAWWSNLSHDSTIRLVEKKHDGDWETYLEKWDSQLVKLEDIAARGSAIVVTKDKIRVEGEELDEYVVNVEERIDVIVCLAEEAAALLLLLPAAAVGLLPVGKPVAGVFVN